MATKTNTNNVLIAGSAVAVVGFLMTRKRPALLGLGKLTTTINPASILSSIYRVVRDLNGFINQAVALTGTPKWLVCAIAGYEIRDKPYDTINPKGVRARGVMQITLPTAVDGLYYAEKLGLLTPEVIVILKRHVGANWAQLMAHARNRSASGGPLVAGALLKPEFNILMGALLLKIGTIQHRNSDGNYNLPKVVLQYNQGFSLGKKLTKPALQNASADTVYAAAPTGEAKQYVANLLAPNAVIDQLRQQGM